MICTNIDDWLTQKDKTIWVCTLTNGVKVYQDDDRPGTTLSAWERLRSHLMLHTDIFIQKMELKFRSHIELVGENRDGWFFVKGKFGSMDGRVSIDRYVTGYVQDNNIYTTAWRIPELLPMECETRKISASDPRCLILRN